MTTTANAIETLTAARDHHLGELAKLNATAKVHKDELAQIDKMLGAAKPKRVVSEETKAKMRAAHAARKAAQQTAAP